MIKTSNKTLISIKNLRISFLKKNEIFRVVKNISFDLLKNEVLGIVGESGSGKSVTALSILKLLPKNKTISKGEVIYNNANLLELSEASIRQVRQKDISIIFQEPMSALNPTMKCIDQLRECFDIEKIDKQNIENEISLLIKKVKLEKVDNFDSKYPYQLSGGQMQRLMIAMAIACKPKLLIADEPTTALDVTVQKEIIELLLEIKRTEGLSIIFISHDLALVSEIADRLIVMYKGKIIEKGKALEIFSNPIENYTKGLLYSRPNNKVKLNKLPTVADYINNSVNNTIINDKEIEISRHKIYSNSPILKIKNLDKYYIQNKVWFKKKKGFKALDGINLELYKGETLGLVGESGCGKSTLVKTIVQIEKASNGSIFYNGADITKLSKSELNHYRKDVQLIFQDPDSSLNPKKTIGSLIMEPMIVHEIDKKDKSYKTLCVNLLKDVGLKKSDFYKYPHELSGGQKQRVGIARAISVGPKVLICDESVSALDVSVQAQVLNLLNHLKKKLKLTYIFISHDLSIVKYMADKIVVMKEGVFKEIGFSEDIYNNPKMEYTKRLIEAIPKGVS
ncbi:ABC transporter ATP-binding protein [Flavobacteriaceae bacterium]|nr:ABC transporter ATP-binding protein [Flavobacteriaceae bacterium]